MVCLDLTLINFWEKNLFFSVFKKYNNDFEYTSKGVLRRITPPKCLNCDTQMNHNGYNIYTKKNLGSVKIGRYICPICSELDEENREFWEDMKTGFFSALKPIYQLLRVHHVSYEGISQLMEHIFPRGKDTIYHAFTDSVEETAVPPLEVSHIVHYDEQFPKRGCSQKYRLTILDNFTAQPIADELHNKKDPETIKEFLERHLNPNEVIFVVTDLYSSYSSVLEEFFGDKVLHQWCLLHLNKRIVNEFPTKTTFIQELTKYRLLNIFYNRDPEIEYLKQKVTEEKKFKEENTEEKYKKWLKKDMKAFKKFVHNMKKERRRKDETLPQRPYFEALETFRNLMDEINSFNKNIQKRLRKIEKHWEKFTIFYFVEGAPATNNLLENYYSTSLKTHRKKQLRTDRGIKNHMKLSAMKRAGLIINSGKTILQMFLKFTPFLNPD